MRNNFRTLSIVEHKSFTIEDIKECVENSDEALASKIYTELENFTKDEKNKNFLSFCKKDTLKAKNYVGIIQTKSGFTLEILPKIANVENKKIACSCNGNYKSDSKTLDDKINSFCEGLLDLDSNLQNISNSNNVCAYCQSKDFFFSCLKTLRNAPFKSNDFANLKAHNLPLLEVFILMFLAELDNLVKKGIKSDYINIDENRKMLKGKIVFNEHLKQNMIVKKGFFTQNDEFLSDIPANRLIVSTLIKLSKYKLSSKTSTRIMQSRFIFDEIPQSKNYKSDFEKSNISRMLKDYHLILQWCKLFLNNQSFMQDSGESECLTLLFDMNVLFESFVAYHLKKYPKFQKVGTQSSGKYLTRNDKEEPFFMLKPDIWIRDKNIICDTKWKILNNSEQDNYGISQGDMYQMWAYATRFEAKKIVLIYPLCEAIKDLKIDCRYFEFEAECGKFIKSNNKSESQNENVKVYINFFPLSANEVNNRLI